MYSIVKENDITIKYTKSDSEIFISFFLVPSVTTLSLYDYNYYHHPSTNKMNKLMSFEKAKKNGLENIQREWYHMYILKYVVNIYRPENVFHVPYNYTYSKLSFFSLFSLSFSPVRTHFIRIV